MSKRPYLTQPIIWLGSKVRARRRILEVIQPIPRRLYVEPFGGSGALFYAKPAEPSVYNDVNSLLVNFFKVLRTREGRDAIRELSKWTPQCRVFWYEFKEVCVAFLRGGKDRLRAAIEAARLADYPEDIAVAFAFFYCQNYGFGGSVLSAFGEALRPTTDRYLPKSFHSRVKHLDLFAESFRLTNITQRDFRDCLEKHDHKKTLFYCDPPYESPSSVDYKVGWSSDDTRDLVALLCDLDGSAALSCYDGELYSPLLDAGYQKKSWSSRASVSRDKTLDSRRVETLYWRLSDWAAESRGKNLLL